MEEANRTYDSYHFASYVAPLLFTCMIPTIMPVGIGALIVLLRFSENLDTYILWNAFFRALQQQIYGEQLERSEQGVYVLYRRKIRKRIMAVLFLAEGIILLCVAVSFWSQFLVEEDTRCDSDFDCYALTVSDGMLVQETQLDIDNCSLFQRDPEYTLQCFRYAFNYIDAIGNAGSVLVIGSLVMNLHSAISAGAYTLNGKKGVVAKTCLFLYFLIGGFVMLVLPPIVVGTTSVVRRALWDTNNGIIQFVAYYFTFNFAFFASGPGFIYPAVFYPPKDKTPEANCYFKASPDTEKTKTMPI